MKFALTAALACALLSPIAAHALAPWDGAWRLDQSRSHFEGPTFSYMKKGNGMWTYSNGGAITFDFGTDGKPYKTIDDDDTTAVTVESDHSWTYTGAFKGKPYMKVHQEVSADEKTLTEHATNFNPDGTKSESDTVYTRVTGVKGFDGKWKTVKQHTNVPDNFTISSGSDGTMTWTIPSQEAYIVSHMDGAPAAIHGPMFPEGSTMEIAKLGGRDFSYKVAIKDKVMGQGKVNVSPDGKTLTDTSWTPGKESEKTTSVYVKQ